MLLHPATPWLISLRSLNAQSTSLSLIGICCLLTACSAQISNGHYLTDSSKTLAQAQAKQNTTDCPPKFPTKAVELLGEHKPTSKGWSHVIKPDKAADFTELSQPIPAYAISTANLKPDETCANQATFQAILVKKLHVWNNNHSNGIETTIPEIPLKEWDAIHFVFKIDSLRTVVPSVETIHAAFPEISDEYKQKIDKGLLNLNLVFRNEEQEAGYFISLDPDNDVDKWLQLTIPAQALSYSKNIDYVHTQLKYTDSLQQHYKTVSIKAETQSKKTVQHFNNGSMPKNQLFKEVGISIHSIRLLTK